MSGCHSVIADQAWILYGLVEGQALVPRARSIPERVESGGSRVYYHRRSVRYSLSLLARSFARVVTAWGRRVGQGRLLPAWDPTLGSVAVGWFVIWMKRNYEPRG